MATNTLIMGNLRNRSTDTTPYRESKFCPPLIFDIVILTNTKKVAAVFCHHRIISIYQGVCPRDTCVPD